MSTKESLLKKYSDFSHKKTVALIVGVVVIIILIMLSWGSKQSTSGPDEIAQAAKVGEFKTEIIYFYGKECARCKNIDKFIKDNQIDSKISFAEKEVWHDGSNDMEMRERAKECNLDPEKVGVPFLWASGKCYVGEVEVEKVLQSEVGSK